MSSEWMKPILYLLHRDISMTKYGCWQRQIPREVTIKLLHYFYVKVSCAFNTSFIVNSFPEKWCPVFGWKKYIVTGERYLTLSYDYVMSKLQERCVDYSNFHAVYWQARVAGSVKALLLDILEKTSLSWMD